MSTKTLHEIALQLGTLVNLELGQQGLYQLRFKFYYIDREGKKVHAQPRSIVRLNQPPHPGGPIDQHNIIPAHVIEGLNYTCSKTFLVRYLEEEISLKEALTFQCEIEDAVETNPIFMLEAELLFSDLIFYTGPKQIIGTSPTDDVMPVNLQVVAKQVFRINGLVRSSFCAVFPLTFDDWHFSLSEIAIHSTVLKIIFPIAEEVPIADRESNIINKINKIIRTTSTESLISKIGEKEIETIYSAFVALLVDSYEKMVVRYSHMIQYCLSNVAIKKKETDLGLPLLKLKKTGSILPLSSPILSDSKIESITKEIIPEGDSENEDYIPISPSSFLQAVMAADPHEIVHNIVEQIEYIEQILKQTWDKYLWMAELSQVNLFRLLMREYKLEIDSGLIKFMVKRRCIHPRGKINLDWVSQDSKEELQNRAQKLRKENLTQDFDKIKIYEENIFGNIEDMPILFVREFPIDLPIVKKGINDNNPLFVLVHGFQGTSCDMKAMKNHIQLLYPEAFFLCSVENEPHTTGDIRDMGFRLAEEVQRFIVKHYDDPKSIGKIK